MSCGLESATFGRRLGAEALGTAFLLVAVVGSGIMAERLAGGNVGLALLANSIATGAALVVLIAVFGPVSGAHFNPAVSLSAAAVEKLPWREVPAYVLAQVMGGLGGVWLTHVMFEEPVLMLSTHERSGVGQGLAEVVATFGLVLAIWASVKKRPLAVPWIVGGYIMAAYWFASSTSFANPAVTIARSFTNTFAGIRPADAPAFIVAELAGAGLAVAVVRWMFSARPRPIEQESNALEKKVCSPR